MRLGQAPGRPMTLRHVVLLSLAADTSADQRQAVLDGLAALPALVPQITGYSFGRDLALGAGNFDLAVVADFDDADDYRLYAAHPEHMRFVTDVLRPILQSRVAVQFER